MKIKTPEQLAEEHWKWLERTLHMIYVDAMIHGIKHGQERKEAFRRTMEYTGTSKNTDSGNKIKRSHRVYIAGALSSKEKTDRTPSEVVIDYLNNVHRMIDVGVQLRKLGYTPYIPALDLLLGVESGIMEEEDYRGCSNEFLIVCDAVLVISMSWGVKQEIKLAKSKDIPIFRSIKQLVKEMPCL